MHQQVAGSVGVDVVNISRQKDWCQSFFKCCTPHATAGEEDTGGIGALPTDDSSAPPIAVGCSSLLRAAAMPLHRKRRLELFTRLT